MTFTIPATVPQAMTSKAQPRENSKSFRPPKTPVGQCFEHRPKYARSLLRAPRSNENSPKEKMGQRRTRMARPMRVEYSESRGFVGKAKKSRDK